jgi:hypothetical protein
MTRICEGWNVDRNAALLYFNQFMPSDAYWLLNGLQVAYPNDRSDATPVEFFLHYCAEIRVFDITSGHGAFSKDR